MGDHKCKKAKSTSALWDHKYRGPAGDDKTGESGDEMWLKKGWTRALYPLTLG
jgi:hypothetical protein